MRMHLNDTSSFSRESRNITMSRTITDAQTNQLIGMLQAITEHKNGCFITTIRRTPIVAGMPWPADSNPLNEEVIESEEKVFSLKRLEYYARNHFRLLEDNGLWALDAIAP